MDSEMDIDPDGDDGGWYGQALEHHDRASARSSAEERPAHTGEAGGSTPSVRTGLASRLRLRLRP